ncbi:hypothetical protein NDU88_005831 [Pleurodeles waltl]|uniref:Uncharacterized protein n=1 Tax=Pleurodeles waltl TaxID=8319 RepID=A0AAV7TBK3_PLEWA|nr:hypothetical protein NDU88_005831 [Pleurodeles waltl]
MQIKEEETMRHDLRAAGETPTSRPDRRPTNHNNVRNSLFGWTGKRVDGAGQGLAPSVVCARGRRRAEGTLKGIWK